MWTIDSVVRTFLEVFRVAGTLLFLAIVVRQYPESQHKRKLQKWLNIWFIVFALTILADALLPRNF